MQEGRLHPSGREAIGVLQAIPEFYFGSKAETLERLKPYVKSSTVLDLFYFEVGQWRKSTHEYVQAIQRKLGPTSLAVRSSALGEDGATQSMAGAFATRLEVDGRSSNAIVKAVESVIASYSGNPRDQILIQPMLDQVAVGGVITTHVWGDGAPYYVINYDDNSGRTDTITGGVGVNKTVLIYRDADTSFIESDRVAQWLEMTKEVEAFCGGVPLEIEFAQTTDEGQVLFQVRRISMEETWNQDVSRRVSAAMRHIETFVVERSQARPGLVGSRTVLGEMPDWNPAEIIGTCPTPLALSLYRRLITDRVWREARAIMGYRQLPGEALLVNIGGHPYIDVRNSFNSFLPADLDDEIAHPLVDAWLDRLDHRPELHDKVEFEVAQTVLDFAFDGLFNERYPGILTRGQLSQYKKCLLRLTKSALDISPNGTLQRAMEDIARLEHIQATRETIRHDAEGGMSNLVRALDMLDECEKFGTLPFSIIARHAFIAESLLRSAVMREALSAERIAQFKSSVGTVTSTMISDLKRACDDDATRAAFLDKYGHLRPGTYDILSPRYDHREDLFRECLLPERKGRRQEFQLTQDETTSLEALLSEAGLKEIPSAHLMEYAKKAIAGREYAKFTFSRDISDALELIAQWGEGIGLTRDDVAYIPVNVPLDTVNSPPLEENELHFKHLTQQGRYTAEVTRALRLGYLIRDARDIYVVPLHRSAPNFITTKRVVGKMIVINNRELGYVDLYNKIVCIENADPGFDWIFARGIAGLITKYGGSNSHMAIRCAEFDLPAAIGCGQQTFDRLGDAGKVELNCAGKVVRPLYEGV